MLEYLMLRYISAKLYTQDSNSQCYLDVTNWFQPSIDARALN
jgi:hypothetical protein